MSYRQKRANVFNRTPYRRTPLPNIRLFCKCRFASFHSNEAFAHDVLLVDQLVPCKEVLIHYKAVKKEGEEDKIVRGIHDLKLTPFSLKVLSMAACVKSLQTVERSREDREEFVKTLKQVVVHTDMDCNHQYKLRTNFVGRRTTHFFKDIIKIIEFKSETLKHLTDVKPFCHCNTLADNEITKRYKDVRIHFFRFVKEGLGIPEHERQERNGHYSFCPTLTNYFFTIKPSHLRKRN